MYGRILTALVCTGHCTHDLGQDSPIQSSCSGNKSLILIASFGYVFLTQVFRKKLNLTIEASRQSLVVEFRE